MVDVIGTISSTLDLIETIRTTHTGIKSANQDVADVFVEIDSLSSAIQSRFGKKVWRYAKFKNKTEDFQTIRQQLHTQFASMNTSVSALQLQRSLQSDERDQQAFTDLQQQQQELRENLQELNKQRDDVQATIQASPENMDEGSKVLHDADEIRKASYGIERRVLDELQRRVTIRNASKSAPPSSTAEEVTASAPITEEVAPAAIMRPARKAVPTGPTFDTKEELGGQTLVSPLQRTVTEHPPIVNSPPPLLHSITAPELPQLPKATTSTTEPSRSNIHISSEEFETAMSKAIANAEARKKGPNKPFSDEDFDAFATLLKQVNKQTWSERPRTYLVLRMIGENRLMNDFILEGCKDIHFPYSENRLPSALADPSSRQSFLDNQYLVLSQKSADLVQGGPHRHLGRSADTGFTIISLLGRGGQGVVDHIRCKLSLKEFARKRLQRQKVFSKDKEGILAFENEIHNLKRLSHRHLVRFVGSYTDPKYVGIIMEPVADTDLRKYLMRPNFPRSDFATLQSFFGCLTSAMMYLHSQKCRHKDIKPGNILLKNNQVLTTDFGIANDSTDLDHDMTAGNPAAFTNAYAAPEVARARPRNMSADVWSMGCVFLDILTVLEGSTLEQQRAHFETEGNFSSAPWDNRVALEAWIAMLGSRSNEHTKPIKWIREMTAEDPTARPTADSLYEDIVEASHAYCGICCNEDAESGASEIDSYCGSDSEVEEVFTKPSALDTRSPDITSGSLAQSPTKQSIERDETTRTSISVTQTNAKDIKTSPVLTRDSTISTERVAGTGANVSYSTTPFHSPDLPGNESFPANPHRTSLTVRDPEGNEIRKTLKTTFATDLSALEARILDISSRRDDWQDLLPQAIRPHDGTVNRYIILHPLAKFENETLASEVLKLYLSEGADVDARDFASNTPLQHAAYSGKQRLVQMLLDAGATCGITNFKSRSALDLACIQKHEEVAKLLITRMSTDELNSKDTGGWTALHHACASGSSPVVKALLEAGANAFIMDKGQCTPFWRCDASITEDISHFHRAWRATASAPSSPALQDATAVSSWRSCDLSRVRSDEGVLKGQRTATVARESGTCSCAACVVISLVKQLPDAGSGPTASTCGCSRHLKETTENILYDVSTVQSCIGICSCKICTEARQDCGKQSDAPEPRIICQCKECSDRNRMQKDITYLVPDLAACDHYKGHGTYDKAIEKALPKLCSCEACYKERYASAVSQLAEKNFKGNLSYRTDPRYAWTHYLEQSLQLATDTRKRQVSSMIIDVLTILLDEGANINSTAEGFTMLHAAVLSGNVAVVNLLIGRKADLDIEAKDGETALMMALMKQDTRILRLLLRSGATINAKSSTRRGPYETRKRSTVLSRAFELYGQLGWMVPMLLAHGPDVDAIDDREHTPLQWAIRHQSLVGVRLLIEAKCSLEKSTDKKPKPLFLAIDETNPEIVKLLTDCGAEVHATESDTTALHRAASVGHVGILNVLMERSDVLPDLQVHCKLDACTPLHYLAEKPGDEVALVGDAMIKAGANVAGTAAEDVQGSTPLHHAAKAGSASMVKLLVYNGAVMEAQNHAGKTPSDFANSKGHREIVELLGGKFEKKWSNFGDRTKTFTAKLPEVKSPLRSETFNLDAAGAKLGALRGKFGRSSSKGT